MNFLDNKEEETFFERPEIKTIGVLFVFVAFCCFVFTMSNHNLQNSKTLERNINLNFFGRVTNKALDASNRDTPFFEVNRQRHYDSSKILWNKLTIGDSVSKTKGSSLVKIYKSDRVVNVDYNDIHRYWDSIYAKN